uniref:MORN repeat protein n=1 Tax=Mimivirus LCMiAC02 TaxID=2506609 RepID=A0A481Z0I8_9VIRU|nr:MAG: MORN repeat protein [Mimivirus LCMiAC02]
MKLTNDNECYGEYDGEWEHGKFHGHGILRHNNGDIYKGEWYYDVKFKGIQKYANGDMYDGEWMDTKLFTLSAPKHFEYYQSCTKYPIYVYEYINNDDENVYELPYYTLDAKKGVIYAESMIEPGCKAWISYKTACILDYNRLFCHGAKYVPSWVLRTIYVGKLLNIAKPKNYNTCEEKHNCAIQLNMYTLKLFTGMIEYAKMVDSEGWIDNKISGYGIMKYANGTVYEGNWKNDKYDGDGIFTLNDGTYYKGYWIKGVKYGYGIEIYPNGDKLKGKWIKGEIYSGTLKNSCGEIKEVWKFGKLQIDEDEEKQNEKLGLLNHLEILN